VSAARLICLAAADEESLSAQVVELLEGGEWGISAGEGPLRAAIVFADSEQLVRRLEILDGWLSERAPEGLRLGRGLVLGTARERPRLGFLFPGQGAPVHSGAGFLEELLPEAAGVYDQADGLRGSDEVPHELVQLAVVTASVAGLRAMAALGIEADFAVGHSVGELTALHWAGALDEPTLLRIARRRGELMTEHASAEGTMANIEAEEDVFAAITDGLGVTVACFNSPLNRVVSGPVQAVEQAVARARAADDARALPLQVIGAFHSPLMLETVPPFESYLAEETFAAPARQVHSTITGTELEADEDLPALLARQMTEPVRFLEAVQEAAAGADLLLEVGPGRMLSRLASEFAPVPAMPLRIGDSSPQDLLSAVGAACVLGMPVRTERLESGQGAGQPRP
jgi:enediyne polyketide synthase